MKLLIGNQIDNRFNILRYRTQNYLHRYECYDENSQRLVTLYTPINEKSDPIITDIFIQWTKQCLDIVSHKHLQSCESIIHHNNDIPFAVVEALSDDFYFPSNLDLYKRQLETPIPESTVLRFYQELQLAVEAIFSLDIKGEYFPFIKTVGLDYDGSLVLAPFSLFWPCYLASKSAEAEKIEGMALADKSYSDTSTYLEAFQNYILKNLHPKIGSIPYPQEALVEKRIHSDSEKLLRANKLIRQLWVLFQYNHLSNIQKEIELGTDDFPYPLEIHTILGFLYDRKEEFGEAVYNLTRAIELKEDHLPSLVLRAWLLNQLGKPERSALEMMKIKSGAPKHLFAQCVEARIASTGETPELGVKLIEEIIGQFPEIESVLYYAGWIYHQNKRPQEAINAYKRSLELNPNMAVTYNELGILAQKTGNMELELSSYGRAIASAPSWALPYYNRGCLHEINKNNDEAIRDYTIACKFNTKDASPPFNRGNILLNMGKVDEALESYQEAVTRNPFHVNAQLNLGNAFLQKKNKKKAMTQFRKVLELEPKNLMGLFNLAALFHRNNDYDEAIRYFSKVIEYHPKNPDARVSKINLLLELGRKKQAYDELIAFKEISPGLARAYFKGLD